MVGALACTTVDVLRVKGIAEDVAIDFGRTWPHRKLAPDTVLHRDAFWGVNSIVDLSAVITPIPPTRVRHLALAGGPG